MSCRALCRFHTTPGVSFVYVFFTVSRMHEGVVHPSRSPIFWLQVLSRAQIRGYAAKDILFGDSCRAAVLQGVEKLADAVQVTLGPKVGCSDRQGDGT